MENKIIEMKNELERLKKENKSKKRTSGKRAFELIEPEKDKSELKKIKTSFNPFDNSNQYQMSMKPQSIKIDSANIFETVKKEQKKNDLFTKKVNELINENAKMKSEINRLKGVEDELNQKIQFLEKFEQKEVQEIAESNDKNEILEKLNELINLERQSKEIIIKRHENNLNKFMKQLESKIEPSDQSIQQKRGEVIEGESGQNLNQIECEEPRKLQRIGYQEFFNLLCSEENNSKGEWDKLEDLYMNRIENFEKNPIKRLSEREIFFIDSPYYFLERLLQENKELLVELKEMESKMRVMVENKFLKNVMKENNKLWEKLNEFKEEKKEIDSIKEKIREVYTQIKTEGEDDLGKMTEYIRQILVKNAEMKEELIKEKKEKLGKVIWNVEVMRKRLQIQEKNEVLDNLHKQMDNKLQGIEKQLKAMELIVMEDLQSSTGEKQIKKDVLVQMIMSLRENLVKRVEDGMKAVTKYFQEFMKSGSNWEKQKEMDELKKEFEKLKKELEANSNKAKRVQHENEDLQKRNDTLLEKNKNLSLRKDELKNHLTTFKKEKKEAGEFIKQAKEMRQKDNLKIEEEDNEKLSTKSENNWISYEERKKTRKQEILSILTQYQKMLLTFQKNTNKKE
jgi:hypothetical protein